MDKTGTFELNREWENFLRTCRQELDQVDVIVEGRLTRIVGLTLEAVGCQAAIGERCLVRSNDQPPVEAEVVGFADNKTYLMPIGDMRGLLPGAHVRPCRHESQVPVGANILGRVLDGRGQPIDGQGILSVDEYRSLEGVPINPLHRKPIRERLDVGVRAINGLLSVGIGQRMGVFAGSGVGKSILLGMMTKYTAADVVVVGLIGERGREVKEFVEQILTEEGMRRAVVVAVPADQPPLLRLHGAMLATSIAEHFCDRGQRVLLLMDSLTRFAQAQREIALAIGEPPATKGYPPSVFTKLPQLLERAGNNDIGGGSITAFYTVLIEGDDYHNDPIADAARAVLDGHIVLSRELAEAGQFPAIDLEASVSRLMTNLCSKQEMELARKFRKLYAKYRENKDLINIGVYQHGSDPLTDEAIERYMPMLSYLCQDMQQAVTIQESIQQLYQVMA